MAAGIASIQASVSQTTPPRWPNTTQNKFKSLSQTTTEITQHTERQTKIEASQVIKTALSIEVEEEVQTRYADTTTKVNNTTSDNDLPRQCALFAGYAQATSIPHVIALRGNHLIATQQCHSTNSQKTE